jgi:hypothetical protein
VTDKPEIFQVGIQIRGPKGDDPGQISRGHYHVTDGVLTLVDPKGNVAQDDNGKIYSAKLAPNDDPQIIAGRLTKQLRDALRGKGAPPSGFSRPLDYPKSGIY